MGAPFLTTLLLDTRVWAWTLTDDRRNSDSAHREIAAAGMIMICAISFFEIAQKVLLGKWREMAPYVERLQELLDRQRGVSASLEAADCRTAGTMD